MKRTVTKKVYNLDAEMVDRVNRLFDAKTDAEVIQQALRKVLEDREVEVALTRMLKAGKFRAIYQ